MFDNSRTPHEGTSLGMVKLGVGEWKRELDEYSRTEMIERHWFFLEELPRVMQLSSKTTFTRLRRKEIYDRWFAIPSIAGPRPFKM
jgi:hypothetical protein